MTSVLKFIEEVKQEATRVTWPTRGETSVSTLMVLAMVVIFGFFFFMVNWALSSAIQALLNIG